MNTSLFTMKTDRIKATEKTTLTVNKEVLPESLHTLRSNSVLSFKSILQDELEKRKGETDLNSDETEDKYHSLIAEFIDLLVQNSGKSFLTLHKLGFTDSLHQIVSEMRKELGINRLYPLHQHISNVSDFIEIKNSLYVNNQSKYRDPVGAQFTGSI